MNLGRFAVSPVNWDHILRATDHESGIDRGSTGVAVETAHLFVQIIQNQEWVYATQKMIGRDVRLEIKLVE
jgi:hypothetical protein